MNVARGVGVVRRLVCQRPVKEIDANQQDNDARDNLEDAIVEYGLEAAWLGLLLLFLFLRLLLFFLLVLFLEFLAGLFHALVETGLVAVGKLGDG